MSVIYVYHVWLTESNCLSCYVHFIFILRVANQFNFSDSFDLDCPSSSWKYYLFIYLLLILLNFNNDDTFSRQKNKCDQRHARSNNLCLKKNVWNSNVETFDARSQSAMHFRYSGIFEHRCSSAIAVDRLTYAARERIKLNGRKSRSITRRWKLHPLFPWVDFALFSFPTICTWHVSRCATIAQLSDV